MGLLAKWKRRRPGIYLVRTDRHIGRGRHNGYVGLSNNLARRQREHIQGTSQYEQIQGPKPWSDLNPRFHCLRLPWWLGFRWCLAPLEALAIWTLLPVYNDKLNRKNPRRVALGVQRNQRAARDRSRTAGYGRRVGLWRTARYHVLRPVCAVLVLLFCLAGLWFTR